MQAQNTDNSNMIPVLDHGFVKLRNLAGPTRRVFLTEEENETCIPGAIRPFDADDTDPANTARLSFDNLDANRAREDDLKLYEYLLTNRHTTPVEMIEVWLEMKLPIFVARQFVRHRTCTINEVSARYVQLPGEWYIPEQESVGLKSKSRKQGRDLVAWDGLTDEEQNIVLQFLNDLDTHNKMGYQLYEHYFTKGIAPELARAFLQVNQYTHWVWKQDLWNLMHFLRLRLDSHAQYEARVYAQAIYDLLIPYLPHSMKLFDEIIMEQGRIWKEAVAKRKMVKIKKNVWDCIKQYLFD
jgi:thymidylate synthase (FAD)